MPGRPFPVEIMYSRDVKMSSLRATYVERAVDTVMHIHKSERPGDILVFLSGSQEIERACGELRKLDEELDYRRDVAHYYGSPEGSADGRLKVEDRVMGLEVFGIYASLETIEQREVFRLPRAGYRKVVFATNIAQVRLSTIAVLLFINPTTILTLDSDLNHYPRHCVCGGPWLRQANHVRPGRANGRPLGGSYFACGRNAARRPRRADQAG